MAVYGPPSPIMVVYGSHRNGFNKKKLQTFRNHELGLTHFEPSNMTCRLEPSTRQVGSTPHSKQSQPLTTGNSDSSQGRSLTVGNLDPSHDEQRQSWVEWWVASSRKLFVADTNNNVIRLIDLKAKEGHVIRTLELKGVQAPALPKTPKRLRRRPSLDTQIIRIKPTSATRGDLHLEISLPSEYQFTKEAPSKFEADVEPTDGVLVEPMDGTLNSEGSALLHFTRSAKISATVRVNCKVYYCKEDEVCLYQNLAFEVPLSPDSPSSSTADIPLFYTLQTKGRV